MVTSPDNLISNRLTAATSPVMSEYDSGIQERYSLLARLNRLVEVVLKPESKNAYGICPFIERTLKQFRLYSYYDESEIFLQARILVIKKIQSGETIKNLPAYLKTIAFNVIRDLHKKRKSQDSLINRLKIKSEIINDSNYSIPSYATEANVKALCKAFEQLDMKERKILILREVHGCTWREIGDILVTRGEENKDNQKLVQQLRQKGHRALKRLRKIYHSL
jgi:RNA polymerase sigma factor (sigma-70 family)